MLLAGAFLSSCVSFPEAPPAVVEPKIANGAIVARDGAELGLSVWPSPAPAAVLIAVHGMNDYAGHFAEVGPYLAARGVSVSAYDQRGFGRSPGFGRWPGEKALVADLNAAIAAARAANPGTPLYVLGHSMGAAVVMAAADAAPLDIDGAILVAPGVWGGPELPFAYRASLNIAATFARGRTLTGKRAKRQSTDNIPVLRAMLADPLVIKPTRLDAILGVVRVMGSAARAADEIGGEALVLYGDKDEIIPLQAMKDASEALCGDIQRITYANGWHLLLRDLDAEIVWKDIAAWVAARNAQGKNAAGPGFGPAASACFGAGRSGAATIVTTVQR